jgi:hypothetical protein
MQRSECRTVVQRSGKRNMDRVRSNGNQEQKDPWERWRCRSYSMIPSWRLCPISTKNSGHHPGNTGRSDTNRWWRRFAVTVRAIGPSTSFKALSKSCLSRDGTRGLRPALRGAYFCLAKSSTPECSSSCSNLRMLSHFAYASVPRIVWQNWLIGQGDRILWSHSVFLSCVRVNPEKAWGQANTLPPETLRFTVVRPAMNSKEMAESEKPRKSRGAFHLKSRSRWSFKHWHSGQLR